MDINREQITELYKEIYQILLSKEYDKCDELLRNYNPEELNMVLLVGLPRLTFMYREHLSEWKPFLKRSYDEISKRNENPDELLKGLLDC